MIFFKLLPPILIICTSIVAENIYQYTDKSGNLVVGNTGKFTASADKTVTSQNVRRRVLEEELEHEIRSLQTLLASKHNAANNEYANEIVKRQNNINRLTKQLNQER
ncbi:MAG: hypothetical protein K0R94_1585 [Burkholderiales bacterium]|jgi:hypothetical protein|nr:hypothetical protein [Burkholderiales bacterium]